MLDPGDITANSGMAKAIFDQLQANLKDELGDISDDDLTKTLDSWKRLSHAIAVGVVTHIRSNMVVLDVNSDAIPVRAVSGTTALESGHAHNAGTLSVTLDNLKFE